MIDSIGPDARIVWAKDEAGEIGKRPTLARDEFEISGESYCRLMAERPQTGRGRR